MADDWTKVQNSSLHIHDRFGRWRPLKRLTDTTEFSPTMPKESPALWPSAEVDSDALDPHYKADISETCPSLGMVVAR